MLARPVARPDVLGNGYFAIGLRIPHELIQTGDDECTQMPGPVAHESLYVQGRDSSVWPSRIIGRGLTG